MYLIQILLPLFDNEGNSLPPAEFAQVRNELTERFGGITAYVRSPAEGLWKENSSLTIQDEIVIYEVMTCVLDRQWWSSYRVELTKRFRQEVLIARVSEIDLL